MVKKVEYNIEFTVSYLMERHFIAVLSSWSLCHETVVRLWTKLSQWCSSDVSVRNTTCDVIFIAIFCISHYEVQAALT